MTSSKKNNDKTKITRITAKDEDVTKKSNKKSTEKNKSEKSEKASIEKKSIVKAKPEKNKTKKMGLLKRLGAYFKGSWQELKKVQWPNRKATWGLTIAVIVFTAFFAFIILLIDIAFQELFNIITSR